MHSRTAITIALLCGPHTCSPEGLAANVNRHIGLLAHSILGTAGQEVADDEVVQRLLLCWHTAHTTARDWCKSLTRCACGTVSCFSHSRSNAPTGGRACIHHDQPGYILMLVDAALTWSPVCLSCCVTRGVDGWMRLVIVTAGARWLPHATLKDGCGMSTPACVVGVLLNDGLQPQWDTTTTTTIETC